MKLKNKKRINAVFTEKKYIFASNYKLLKHFIMGFMEAVKACFAKYATFDGRACRSEYWYWVLFNFLVGIFLGWIPYLGTILSILFILPSIAVGVRRLHDIGKSGWWYLLSIIPIIGWVAMIYFCVLDSQPGINQYGSNPKGIGNQE